MTDTERTIISDQFRRALENLENYNPAATPEMKKLARELIREGILQAMHCVARGLWDSDPNFSVEGFCNSCTGKL